MPRTPRIPVLLLSLVPGCYSPNDDVIASDGGGGSTDGSADSTGGTTASGGMTGPGTTDPTGDTTEDPSASTGEVSDTEADTTGGAPVCGNGEVEGDEVCDDGVNDGGYGGCTADCTALGPHCGDDAVQGAEDCDDGDDENGDGCNIDCTISGEIVWTRTFDDEYPNGIAIDADDGVGVVTSVASVHRLDSEGSPDWDVTITVANANSPRGVSIAYDPATGWLAAGEADTVAQGQNAWWRRVDESGVLGAAAVYDSPAHADEYLGGVAFDESGDFVTAGTTDDDEVGSWIRKLDSRGALLWSLTLDGGTEGAVESVSIDHGGNVIVVGSTFVGGQGYNAWLRKYDPEGAELWTRTSTSEGALADVIRAVAVGADDTIAVGGEEADDIWVRAYTPGGVALWTHVYDSPSYDAGFLSDAVVDVAVDSSGAVVAAGVQMEADADLGAWVRKFGADGDVLWTALPVADVESSAQFANSIAVDSNDYVIVGGSTALAGGVSQGWIQKYTP